MKLLALLPLPLLLMGCKDERPPRWLDVCVRSVSQTVPVIVPTTGQVSIAVVTTCVSYERRCVVGQDYKGEKKCP